MKVSDIWNFWKGADIEEEYKRDVRSLGVPNPSTKICSQVLNVGKKERIKKRRIFVVAVFSIGLIFLLFASFRVSG